MVPRTLPNSDILCQVTAGHGRRAHSRCSNTCIPSPSIGVLGFSYKPFSEHLWEETTKSHVFIHSHLRRHPQVAVPA